MHDWLLSLALDFLLIRKINYLYPTPACGICKCIVSAVEDNEVYMDLFLGHLVGGLYKLWTYSKMTEEYLTQIYFKYDQQREGEKQPPLCHNEGFSHFLS